MINPSDLLLFFRITNKVLYYLIGNHVGNSCTQDHPFSFCPSSNWTIQVLFVKYQFSKTTIHLKFCNIVKLFWLTKHFTFLDNWVLIQQQEL